MILPLMLKIALTGSNGFVGSSLVRNLTKENCAVNCLVREGSNIDLLPENSFITYINYNNRTVSSQILSDHDIIIHNAALTKAKKWEDFNKVNIELTDYLVSVCNNSSRIKQMIFISSQAASGSAPSLEEPKKETDKCYPVSAYGRSKMLAEEKIIENCEKPYTIIRPAAVFGPGDSDFLIYFKLIKKHISFRIGYREHFLNMIYVEDLGNIIKQTIMNPDAFNNIFFAAYNEKISYKQLNQYLEKSLNTFTNPIRIPEVLLTILGFINTSLSSFRNKPLFLNKEKIREMKKLYWLVDNTKIKTVLNFKPEFDLLEAFIKTYTWYKDNNWM